MGRGIAHLHQGRVAPQAFVIGEGTRGSEQTDAAIDRSRDQEDEQNIVDLGIDN
jgi:hypothetical protein